MAGIVEIPKIPELRKRIFITIIMLAIFRLGVFIPTPGIDTAVLADFFRRAEGTIFGLINLFSGGALRNFSIFALGIMPYISASIILQLLTAVFPSLEEMQKEGEVGRKKITQYTRYLTVGLCIFQGFFIAVNLEKMQGPAGQSVVYEPGWNFRLMSVMTLTAGTIFLMWLGEQITERGIGNGISILIFAGIVARIPSAIANVFRMIRAGEMPLFKFLFLLLLMVIVVAFIIFMERAHRRIPIQYAKRVVGRRVYGGVGTYLPLKVNPAGVIPPIFASSLLMFPMTLANFGVFKWADWFKQYFYPGKPIHDILYIVLIIFFTYFYTAVIFNPVDVAENLQKFGGFIPGIRPGKSTSDYIDKVLSRIILWGSFYLSLVCVLPFFLVRSFNVPFYFGGTALLIVVGVAMDTMQQIESHLVMRNYDGVLKKSRIKGRRGY